MPFAVVIGLLFWLTAAAVDSLQSSRVSFLDSLLYYEGSPHNHYLRLLIFSGFVLFGILANRLLTERKRTAERYRDLVALSNDIITIADGDGKCVYLNDAGYRILERTPEEVIGRSFMEFWHTEDRKIYLKRLEEQARLKTDTFLFENRYLTKRGRTINVVQTVRVLRNARGKIIGTQSMARDITEHRQADASMQKALARAADEQARLEALLSSINDGICVLNREFQILYQNQAYGNIVGGDKQGEFCYQAYTPGDSLCPGCPLEKVFRDGESRTLEKELSENGERRFIEITLSPLKDASGAIVAGIETIRDVTALRSAEAKMRMFSVAIEEAMDGIQIIRMDGHIVYSNKAVEELFGFSHEELVGKHVSEMHVDQGEEMRAVIPTIEKTGRWHGELQAVHKDGRHVPVWFSLSVVRGEHGMPVAMIATLQDISERKQTEELVKRHEDQLTKTVEDRTRELMDANEKLRREIADREIMAQDMLESQKHESRGTLAGGIVHDFKNLLFTITGNISLAMQDLTPDNRAYRKLKGAEKASLRAQELIGRTLTFSKDRVPVKKTAAISDLIREVTEFMLRDSRMKLFFSLPADLWPVDMDEGQIGQALHNLLINADQAMPGGGTITISCENDVVTTSSNLPLSPGNYVRINIRDHGVGISRENLSKIFDPYFTAKQEGNGLGLAASYSIIKKHGGHIYAESERGGGTTFIIYLPESGFGKVFKGNDEMQLITGTGNSIDG